MTDIERLLQRSCQSAATELGVRIQSPFTLIDSRHESYRFIAYFEQFASDKGVLICHADDWVNKNAIAANQGYYCSGLHPDSYGQFDRELWMVTLEEWGWQGEERDRPEWYRGPVQQ